MACGRMRKAKRRNGDSAKQLAEREAQRAKDSTVEEFSQRLTARGVPEQAIQEAVAEMRAGR
jgi:hypothetical protein